MIVRWSTINVHAEGVYDVSYACPHCGYSTWARARGTGWRELKPVPPPWSVFDRTADGVEFLHEDPYRGAAPKHEEDSRRRNSAGGAS